MTTTTITWHRVADRLPDDDMTCLLALSDGEVTTGWHEDGRWHDIGAWPYEDHQVTDWAEMPEAPK